MYQYCNPLDLFRFFSYLPSTSLHPARTEEESTLETEAITSTAFGTGKFSTRRLAGSNARVLIAEGVIPRGAMTRKGQKTRRARRIAAGSVLVPYWEGYGTKEEQRMYRIFPGGIFDALRSLLHALFGYGARGGNGELQELERILCSVDGAVEILLGRHPFPSPALDTARRALAGAALELDRVRNEAKVKARDSLAKASTLTVSRPDGADQHNVPATVWRVDGAQGRLRRRARQVERIAPRVAFFEQTLLSEIGRILRQIEWMVRTLHKEAARLEKRKKPYGASERDLFFRRVSDIQKTLREIRCAPFVGETELAYEDLSEAVEAFREGGCEQACRLLRRAERGLRCKLAQAEFERKVVFPLSLRMGLGMFSAHDAQRFIAAIGTFRAAAETRLDDSDFRKPVKQRLIAAFDAAMKLLRAEDFAAAKEAVKRASRAF